MKWDVVGHRISTPLHFYRLEKIPFPAQTYLVDLAVGMAKQSNPFPMIHNNFHLSPLVAYIANNMNPD